MYPSNFHTFAKNIVCSDFIKRISTHYSKEFNNSPRPAYILNRSIIQGDQKVYVHLIITIQKFTNNVQSVPRQSPDRGTLDSN
jgi:hypothetical protein